MAINSFTWAQIKKHVFKICGESDDAMADFYDHATAGYRTLCGSPLVKSEELFTTTTLTVSDGDDYVAQPADCFWVASLFNLTTGQTVDPEEHGWRGRMRHFEETTGKPPSGEVFRYWPANDRIYVRNTSDGATSLQLYYKIIPPDVTSSDDANRPVTPAQLDWPLIWLIASNYFTAHPHQTIVGTNAEGKPIVTTGLQLGEHYRQQANSKLMEQEKPVEEETRDHRDHFVLRHYSPNP